MVAVVAPSHPSLPLERTWLLLALRSAQRAEGWVSAEALAAIAAHHKVPLGEAWAVATNYPEVRLVKPDRQTVRVCTGLSCRLAGGLTSWRGRSGDSDCVQARPVRMAPSASRMDCAFTCGVAPVIEVGHQLRGRLVPQI